MRPLITLLVLGLLVSTSACSGRDKDAFRNVDHDKNGKISYEELLFVFPDATPDVFRQSDTDRDGFLSESEYAQFLKRVAHTSVPTSATSGKRNGASDSDTLQPAVPYKGEEVIEVRPPALEAPHATPAKAKPEKGRKDAKNKPDTSSRTETLQYTVARGDNLTKIALKFGVSVEDITRANGNMPPDTLRDGQVLNIPPHP
ncbi:MAG: LysM peptidoglycan-binding domain-containing protein [Desulfovibrionaceae bacterium]